uniref:Uncharacterized protein n=1 Tax=Mycena chlorophos TaxID=658473 RepID=A0ABQ0L4C4_MYCCL|nr:predicted protein [Mycena chlorophos]
MTIGTLFKSLAGRLHPSHRQQKRDMQHSIFRNGGFDEFWAYSQSLEANGRHLPASPPRTPPPPEAVFFNEDAYARPFPDHMYLECDVPFCKTLNPPLGKPGAHHCVADGCSGNYFVTPEQAKDFRVMIGLRKMQRGCKDVVVGAGLTAVRKRNGSKLNVSTLGMKHSNASTATFATCATAPTMIYFPTGTGRQARGGHGRRPSNASEFFYDSEESPMTTEESHEFPSRYRDGDQPPPPPTHVNHYATQARRGARPHRPLPSAMVPSDVEEDGTIVPQSPRRVRADTTVTLKRRPAARAQLPLPLAYGSARTRIISQPMPLPELNVMVPRPPIPPRPEFTDFSQFDLDS